MQAKKPQLPKEVREKSKKRQEPILTEEEQSAKKLFEKLEQEVQVIENNNTDNDEGLKKASILTFKGSSKGPNSSPSKKQANIPVQVAKNSPQRRTSTSPFSKRVFQKRDNNLPKPSFDVEGVKDSGLPNPFLPEKDSMKQKSRDNGNQIFKEKESPEENKTPRNKSRKIASKIEVSTNFDSPEATESKNNVKRSSKIITPIADDTYQKLTRKSNLRSSNYVPFELQQIQEVKPRPTINKNSENINKRLNRGNYDNVHERLFYKGIEQIKRKEELENIEFNRTHTFRPNTGNSPKAVVHDKDIDKLVYSYKRKDLVVSRQKALLEAYDLKDGSLLYTPRINKHPPVKHKYSLKEIEGWKTQRKDYLIKLRQIFDFLDQNNSEIIDPALINYENIHPDLELLLEPFLDVVENYGKPLTFPVFFELIEAHDLTESVINLFDTINREPLINPKPLKEKSFKFSRVS